MDLRQALVLVLIFPAVSGLLLALTVIEERLLGGPAAPPPGNAPEVGESQQRPAPARPAMRPAPARPAMRRPAHRNRTQHGRPQRKAA